MYPFWSFWQLFFFSQSFSFLLFWNYSPKLEEGNSEYDGDKVEEFYKKLFDDLNVDAEENAELMGFFSANIPPKESLVPLRATAFKAAVDYLSDDKANNISVLRCINVAVHCFERTCLL